MSNKHLINDQFDVDLLADSMKALGPLGFELKSRDDTCEGKMAKELLKEVDTHISEAKWTWLPIIDRDFEYYGDPKDVDEDTKRKADGYRDWLQAKDWSYIRVSWGISEAYVLDYAGFRDREQLIHDVAVMASIKIHMLSADRLGFLQPSPPEFPAIDFFIIHPNYT